MIDPNRCIDIAFHMRNGGRRAITGPTVLLALGLDNSCIKYGRLLAKLLFDQGHTAWHATTVEQLFKLHLVHAPELVVLTPKPRRKRKKAKEE